MAVFGSVGVRNEFVLIFLRGSLGRRLLAQMNIKEADGIT